MSEARLSSSPVAVQEACGRLGSRAPFPRPGVQASGLTPVPRDTGTARYCPAVPPDSRRVPGVQNERFLSPKLCSFTLNIPASPCRLGPSFSSRRGRVGRAPETLSCAQLPLFAQGELRPREGPGSAPSLSAVSAADRDRELHDLLLPAFPGPRTEGERRQRNARDLLRRVGAARLPCAGRTVGRIRSRPQDPPVPWLAYSFSPL